MARVIVVAQRRTDPPDALDGDRRTFQLKERVTSSDARDPHVAAQLIERPAWGGARARLRHSRGSWRSAGRRSRGDVLPVGALA